MAAAVAATAAAAAGGGGGGGRASSGSGGARTKTVTIMINKEDAASKVGVTLTSEPSDPYPVVTSISESGAAASGPCQLQGVLMAGDRITSLSGYTRVVHLDTHAKWSAGPTAAMLRKAVGLIKFRVKRAGSGEVVEVGIYKESAGESLGIELTSAAGDRLDPTVTAAPDRFTRASPPASSRWGISSSRCRRRPRETIGIDATLGADGHAAKAATAFLVGARTGDPLRRAHRRQEGAPRRSPPSRARRSASTTT